MITFPFWDVESVSRPQLLSDDFNIRLPSSEWSSSEVKISRHDTSSSSRSGCEDIFINKQLTGHSHAFTASLPLRGIEWTWTGKWGTGQREATGEQGSERRAQCENCCMKFKVSSGQMHFLFCVMTRLLVQRYLKCLMPRYSPILHLTNVSTVWYPTCSSQSHKHTSAASPHQHSTCSRFVTHIYFNN